jgi:hypothetical protein
MRIVFCALARNCRRRLNHNKKYFQSWQKAFPDARWIFVENDSTDGTRQWLEKWAAEDSRVSVIGDNTGELTIPIKSISKIIPGYSLHRIERMARFRNLYLDWIDQEIGWDQLDAMVVIDPDLRGLPSKRVIYQLKNLSIEHAITALGERWRSIFIREFHDSYAYRELGDEEPQTLRSIKENRAILLPEICKWADSRQVRSNFNGLGIYPIISGMRECRYVAQFNEDAQVEAACEHVAFHDQLAAKGVKIMLDPKMRIFYNGWIAVSTGRIKLPAKRLFRRLVWKF